MANSLTGITDIELLPAFNYREVVGRLQTALRASDKFRAAVAYWCVGTKEIGPELVKRLSGDGFLCVDIHMPTDIDRLCQMKLSGANVYLYLLNPNPQPGELKSKVPPHLLHPKMLLFDYPSAAAELWVGSHNWTARALTGVNVEASLRVRLTVNSCLYSDAANFLEAIRASCVPFDVNAVGYYKWLQQIDQEEEIWVLELRGVRSALDKERGLTVFGRSEEDYRNLKSVDKNIVVSLLDQASGKEILYEAAIRNTGRDPSQAGLTFDARLYASHDGTPRPPVEGPKVPLPAIVTAASSWATVAVVEELFGETFEIPPKERWLPAEESAGRFQLPPELRQWFPNPSKPLLQRPVPREVYEQRSIVLADETPLLVARVPKLLRKKVVRAKRQNGQSFSLTGKRRSEDEERK